MTPYALLLSLCAWGPWRLSLLPRPRRDNALQGQLPSTRGPLPSDKPPPHLKPCRPHCGARISSSTTTCYQTVYSNLSSSRTTCCTHSNDENDTDNKDQPALRRALHPHTASCEGVLCEGPFRGEETGPGAPKPVLLLKYLQGQAHTKTNKTTGGRLPASRAWPCPNT